MTTAAMPEKRRLPKLLSCRSKASTENHRQRLLFSLNYLDANGVRRQKIPLHEYMVLELRESGFRQAAAFMEDLLYDNQQLLKRDYLGIIVDLRKAPEYMEYLRVQLERAEHARDREQVNMESVAILTAARHFAECKRGILWLADKLFLTAIAIASQYEVDGGRQKLRCKYYFGKFLLDKFPELNTSQAYDILNEVRDCCSGKPWLLFDPKQDKFAGSDIKMQEEGTEDTESMFVATNLLLYKVLCDKLEHVRRTDPLKAERIARLAVRRAYDGGNQEIIAKAYVEKGLCQFTANNLNTAMASFSQALKIFGEIKNIQGICVAKLHLAAVVQRTGKFAEAEQYLTEVGATAIAHQLQRLLGRSLQLLGELHLHCGRTHLATLHLTEAFLCYMGCSFYKAVDESEAPDMGVLFSEHNEVYANEAEQSRLMMAISAGEEVMESYIKLLGRARECNVDKVKIMEWKLCNLSWITDMPHHKFIPCLCPRHNRSPLDVLKLKLAEGSDVLQYTGSYWTTLNRQASVQDVTLLTSVRRLQSAHSALSAHRALSDDAQL